MHNAAKTLHQDESMARRFVSPLTEEEQQALTDAHEYGETRALRRRAHAILLSHQGYTIVNGQVK